MKYAKEYFLYDNCIYCDQASKWIKMESLLRLCQSIIASIQRCIRSFTLFLVLKGLSLPGVLWGETYSHFLYLKLPHVLYCYMNLTLRGIWLHYHQVVVVEFSFLFDWLLKEGESRGCCGKSDFFLLIWHGLESSHSSLGLSLLFLFILLTFLLIYRLCVFNLQTKMTLLSWLALHWWSF